MNLIYLFYSYMCNMYSCWAEVWPGTGLSVQSIYVFNQYLPLVVVPEPRQWLLSVTSGSRCHQATQSPFHLPLCWVLFFVIHLPSSCCHMPEAAPEDGRKILVFPAWMILLPSQASWNNLWHIPVCWGQRGKLHIFGLFVLFYLFKVRFSWYKTSIMLLLFREAPGGELLHVCYLTGGLMTFIGGRWPSQFWGSHYHSGWGYFFICRVPLCQGNIPLILHIIAQVLHPSLPFWDTLKCTRDTWVHPSSSCNSWGVFSCPSLCTTSPSRCWCIRHICCLGVLLRMSCVPAHAVKAPCQAGEGARSRR